MSRRPGRPGPAPGARSLTCPSCGAPLRPGDRACRSCGAALLTRRCAACFELGLAGDRNCRRCGARLSEEAAAGDRTSLTCAGCGAAMLRRQAGALRFDECDRCGSLWLSPEAAEQVTTSAETRSMARALDPPGSGAPAAPAAAPRAAYRRCPSCSKMMNRKSFALGSGVVLDVCREHGAYFDRGELTRVVGFIESGGLERARRREAEALKGELGEARRRMALAARGEGAAEISIGSEGPGILDLLRYLAARWVGGR